VRAVVASLLAAGIVAVASALAAASDAPSSGGAAERVVQVSARRFSYTPDVIELELGVPAIVELTSLDREHGFAVPDLGLRIDVEPGKTARVRVVPEKVGTFPFHCDVFCGSGHEEMAGRIVVVAARQAHQ
jgi:cytochrome c oxidase subunit II